MGMYGKLFNKLYKESTMKKEHRVKISLTTSLLLYNLSNLQADSTMEGVGDLPGGTFLSPAYALSGDGTTVVGTSNTLFVEAEAYRWTQSSGIQSIGDLAGGAVNATANGVNSDGSVIVGDSINATQTMAFRWTQAGGMVALGDLGGGYSSARAISDDGSVIVGVSNSGTNEAFRWTQATGMHGIGMLGAYTSSKAFGVSADGNVIVGTSGNLGGDWEAFKYTQAGGMINIGDLAGGAVYAVANAASYDGSVIVGYSDSALGHEAYRWTQSTGMVGLGILTGGSYSRAFDVNSDGSVIVGVAGISGGYTAIVWSQNTGMQTLEEWLGIPLTGWSDTIANGISDDGTTVAGYGTSPNGTEGFIAKNGQGLIGINDFTASLESINSSTAQSIANISMLLHGAHGHPGNRRAIDDKRVMWVAGDISSDNRHNSNDDGYIGEVGVSIKYNDQITYSIAIGKILGKSELDYKGTIHNNGEYIIADTDIKPFKDIPLYSTTTLGYGKNDIEIKRGYDNGGVLTHSTGNTDEIFLAFKQRLQYQFETFLPYIQYNHIQVRRDGYTESGGGFPAVYDSIRESVSDWRIGVDANFELNDLNTLVTTLETIHRAQEKGSGVSGQIIGLGSFSIDGREYDQDWMRATVGIEHIFENNSRFTLTLNRTSKGEEQTFWSGFNYSISF
jgi:probable HAF family extracellular repeat protein